MKTPKIFLSYAREDAEFAQSLAVKLREAGATLWIDQLDIAAGARWDIEVGKALETSECLLVILSKNSVESNNVLDEVFYALDSNRRVVPIVIDDCDIPFRLKRLQFVDFSRNFDQAFERLLNSLNGENTKKYESSLSEPVRSKIIPASIAKNTPARSEHENPPGDRETSPIKKGAQKTNAAKNFTIGVLILAIAGLIFFLKKSGSKKEENLIAARDTLVLGAINKNTANDNESAANKDTTSNKDTVRNVDKPQPPIKDTSKPKKDLVIPPTTTLIINRGQFVFNTTKDARERGDVFINISQSGKTVWKEKIPAQSSWAALSKYNFDMPVNEEMVQGPALTVTLSLCSPRGRDISWSGEAEAVLFQSNNTKKAFKSAFTLNTSKGSGIPKCDEVSMTRVMPEIKIKTSAVKAVKVL